MKCTSVASTTYLIIVGVTNNVIDVTNSAKTINYLAGYGDFATLSSINNVESLSENEQKQ